MKYNNIIFLGLCLGLTTYSALSADSVIKISGRVLDYGLDWPPESPDNQYHLFK
ncbi:hypothetical protein NIHE151569_10750 [Escherichia coli]|nr:hypothetical protein NIHE151569_10750 [Escherichia coli]